MTVARERIIDALDIETVFDAVDEHEARLLSASLLTDCGFQDVSVVSVQTYGAGFRVRVRAYMFRPGDQYAWLMGEEGKKNEA